MLVDDIILSKDEEVANTFNTFFIEAVNQLNVRIAPELISSTDHLSNPVEKAVKRFDNHPSILVIKEKFQFDTNFSFQYISIKDMKDEIENLQKSKAFPKETMPTSIIVENVDIFSTILHNNFNNNIYSGIFPSTLKRADISPIYKCKGDRDDKSSYRPISILHVISKIYERLILYQMNDYFEFKLSKFQCGYRKGYSAQYCLLFMLEKWKHSVDNGEASGALLTDMSKAFDCLSHDLLIAKLEAYGFDDMSLKFIHSYLSRREQRVRNNSKYSSWSQIICGVPQGSILGPLLFNIYLADIFIFTKGSHIANFADDNTPYAFGSNTKSVIETLENDSLCLFQWFNNNAIKINPEKSHLILSNPNTEISALINEKHISNENNVKLLGVIIDNRLTYTKHVSNLCQKASKKLHALYRVASYMGMEKRRLLMKSFIQSQFGYCPLIWMLHSRKLNNRINRIHEKSLRLVYNDDASSFEDLLKRDNSFTIHQTNLQSLAIELYKAVNSLSPEFMKEIFPVKSETRYCSRQVFITKNIRTVQSGSETLTYLGPKLWLLIPDEIKNVKTLYEFKRKIKTWKPDKCPCRLCMNYVQGVGFVTLTG